MNLRRRVGIGQCVLLKSAVLLTYPFSLLLILLVSCVCALILFCVSPLLLSLITCVRVTKKAYVIV